VSDKELTVQCGTLDLLEPLLGARGVDCNIPPMKLQPQLTENELKEDREFMLSGEMAG
jgi:hypothetical protein